MPRQNISDRDNSDRRMPPDSLFYSRIVPALLVVLAVIMVLFVIVALGIFVGIVPYR